MKSQSGSSILPLWLRVRKLGVVWTVAVRREPPNQGVFRTAEVMIPAMIWDLQERFPPLDVPPSEGLASGWQSCHGKTRLQTGFNHRRRRTTSTLHPTVTKSWDL